jgi:hypothetical protein
MSERTVGGESAGTAMHAVGTISGLVVLLLLLTNFCLQNFRMLEKTLIERLPPTSLEMVCWIWAPLQKIFHAVFTTGTMFGLFGYSKACPYLRKLGEIPLSWVVAIFQPVSAHGVSNLPVSRSIRHLDADSFHFVFSSPI